MSYRLKNIFDHAIAAGGLIGDFVMPRRRSRSLLRKASQLGLFGGSTVVGTQKPKRRVQAPGSRGSTKWWVDEQGQIRYDERPQAAAPPPPAPPPPAPPPAAPPPPPDDDWRRVRSVEELEELSRWADVIAPDPKRLLASIGTIVHHEPTPFGRTPNEVEWARRFVARAFGIPHTEGWHTLADEVARAHAHLVPPTPPPQTDFWVEDRRWNLLEARLKQLNVRAKRLKVQPLSIDVIGEPELRDVLDKRGRATGEKHLFRRVRIVGESPKLPDWQFWATLQHLRDPDTGKVVNIVRSVPGPAGDVNTIPVAYREQGQKCDHCRTDRHRVDTFVLRHTRTGEFRQVGRDCLKDFLGHADAEGLAAHAELLSELALTLQEASAESWGDFEDESADGRERGAAADFYDLEKYLAAVVRDVKDRGYKKRGGEHELPTARAAWMIVYPGKNADPFRPTPEELIEARDAIAWVESDDFAGDKGLNDYQHNLRTAVRVGAVTSRTDGIVASLIPAFHRWRGDVLQRAKAKQESQHIGEVGKRGEHTITILRVIPKEGLYGTTYITGFVDEHGNQGVWFASGPHDMEPGETWRVKGTVKKHDEWQGIKQTTFSRMAPIKKLGGASGAGLIRKFPNGWNEDKVVAASISDGEADAITRAIKSDLGVRDGDDWDRHVEEWMAGEASLHPLKKRPAVMRATMWMRQMTSNTQRSRMAKEQISNPQQAERVVLDLANAAVTAARGQAVAKCRLVLTVRKSQLGLFGAPRDEVQQPGVNGGKFYLSTALAPVAKSPQLRNLYRERERISTELFYLTDEDLPSASPGLRLALERARADLARRKLELDAQIDRLNSQGRTAA